MTKFILFPLESVNRIVSPPVLFNQNLLFENFLKLLGLIHPSSVKSSLVLSLPSIICQPERMIVSSDVLYSSTHSGLVFDENSLMTTWAKVDCGRARKIEKIIREMQSLSLCTN